MERISVGMISAGSSQVVALGPNWPQKEEKKYRNCGRGEQSKHA